MAEATPMVRQYLEAKGKHKDAILFFRLGDFYEMFNEDAEAASRELDLVLTGRGSDENRMPMCGIPYHAAENYIARLIDRGYKVAICEQVEDPKTATGVVKREVIRVITPGTVIESNLLSEKKNNYLAAVTKEGNRYGLAYIDASTGEFRVTELTSDPSGELDRIAPAEVLVSDLIKEELPVKQMKTAFKDIYDAEAAERRLTGFFKVKTLNSFGLETVKAGWGAAAAILDYLKETQKTALDQVRSIHPYHPGDYMFIDTATRDNLELVQTVREKSFRGSLLWVLDRTRTSMGARRLRNWLLQPLLDGKQIEERLDAVEELFGNAALRAETAQKLKEIADIERAAGRIASGSANARDLAALKQSLERLPALKASMAKVTSLKLKEILGVPDFTDVRELIEKAVVDDPPFALKDGGLIKPGYDPELDEIRNATREGKDWIARLENEERQKTGIKSLKVGYTKVFGYYIEVTNSNLSQVPPNYIRKQTLVNCERFITPELKEKESMVLNSDQRMKDEEYRAFCEVRGKVSESTSGLQELSAILGQIDIFLSLAETAVENGYSRPKIAEGENLEIIGGRHPVVEKMIGGYQFVPNDTLMDEAKSRFLLITGPNMAGKSTYMRQVALIVLLAQIGSFVPAKRAAISLVDRIFTRIGAMDDIFSGQSTFMLEMTEAANILHNASERSLIILDEIGRGTATFDGMSIAAAIAEYIHEKIKARTLFATHYHEITQLADNHPGMINLNVAVKEEGEKITFLHRIVPGPADRSYGIQVARLAGFPKSVLDRAKEIYNTLEMVENDLGQEKATPKRSVRPSKDRGTTGREQPSLF
ncbi:MAG TPA: DNA mismatch repair protein MutS [Candidatus Omnitrophota bacterium]|nr:DNA mismatch repair protein MutS [Candidatus Omnitrophota bacterium]